LAVYDKPTEDKVLSVESDDAESQKNASCKRQEVIAGWLALCGGK
jgi:hypothetical protein